MSGLFRLQPAPLEMDLLKNTVHPPKPYTFLFYFILFLTGGHGNDRERLRPSPHCSIRVVLRKRGSERLDLDSRCSTGQTRTGASIDPVCA